MGGRAVGVSHAVVHMSLTPSPYQRIELHARARTQKDVWDRGTPSQDKSWVDLEGATMITAILTSNGKKPAAAGAIGKSLLRPF